MRVAILDLGLRSFDLSVFETGRIGAGGPMVSLRSWSESVRLAAGMTGHRLSGSAIARGLIAVQHLLRDLAAFDTRCRVVAIASSALRAVEDGMALCDEVRRRHGLRVELLSGEGEARLSYLGATVRVGSRGRVAVADLGAESLELATGTDGDCDLVHSVPIGGMLLHGLTAGRAFDRGARERVAAMVRFAAADAARAIWDRRPDCLVFTSGAAEGLGVVAEELGLAQPGARDLGLSQLARLADILAQFQPIELPALGIEEARSDEIAVGAVALHALMELLGSDSALIAPGARREGVAVRYLGSARYAPVEDRVHLAVT